MLCFQPVAEYLSSIAFRRVLSVFSRLLQIDADSLLSIAQVSNCRYRCECKSGAESLGDCFQVVAVSRSLTAFRGALDLFFTV